MAVVRPYCAGPGAGAPPISRQAVRTVGCRSILIVAGFTGFFAKSLITSWIWRRRSLHFCLLFLKTDRCAKAHVLQRPGEQSDGQILQFSSEVRPICWIPDRRLGGLAGSSQRPRRLRKIFIQLVVSALKESGDCILMKTASQEAVHS